MKALATLIKELETLVKKESVEKIKAKNQEVREKCKEISHTHKKDLEIVRALMLIDNSCADLNKELEVYGTRQRAKTLRIVTTMRIDLEKIANILKIELHELWE